MSDAKAKHVKHLLHLDSLEYVWCKHIMRARQFSLPSGGQSSSGGKMFVQGAKIQNFNLRFFSLSWYSLLLSSCFRIKSPWKSHNQGLFISSSLLTLLWPIPLLQHHPPSLRPAVPYLWINWAQWTDRFFFHQAGCTPEGHFRCLLFPALGRSSTWPVECFLTCPLCSPCFLASKGWVSKVAC